MSKSYKNMLINYDLVFSTMFFLIPQILTQISKGKFSLYRYALRFLLTVKFHREGSHQHFCSKVPFMGFKDPSHDYYGRC